MPQPNNENENPGAGADRWDRKCWKNSKNHSLRALSWTIRRSFYMQNKKKWMRISESKSVLPSTAPTRDTESKEKYTPNQEDRRHEVARKQATIADEPVWKSSECCCCCDYWCSPWLHVKLCNLRVFSSRNEFVTISVRSHCTDVWEFHWSAANLSLDRY